MKEIVIPTSLMSDVETIDKVIDALKLAKKELQGKVVSSTDGILNKIKYYFLGYLLIQRDVDFSKDPLLIRADNSK